MLNSVFSLAYASLRQGFSITRLLTKWVVKSFSFNSDHYFKGNSNSILKSLLKPSVYAILLCTLSSVSFATTRTDIYLHPLEKAEPTPSQQKAAKTSSEAADLAALNTIDNASKSSSSTTKGKTETAAQKKENTEDLFNLINSASPQLKKHKEPADPYSGYNHWMFGINESLDKHVAKPLAKLYVKIMPAPLSKMFNNFFSNIDNVTTVANDILQANFYQATSDGWRLLINSTVGVGGLFDVASKVGLRANYEDFGLTLASWGWTKSDYFILPVLGPSTVRDALSKIVNYRLSPFPYVGTTAQEYGLYAWYLLNERVQFMEFQGVYNNAAIDPYVFMRDAYIQRRNYLIKRNKELNDPYTAQEMRQYYNPNYLYQ
jgi:phospholipid-binding lipoprotein MlaA